MRGGDVGFAFERRLYYAARFLGQAAQNIWLAALFLVAGTSGQPAVHLSSLFLAMLLPSVLFGLAGGSLADRLGPAKGLAIGSAWRLSSVAAGFFLLDGGTSAWVLAFFYSMGSQLFTPAEMALVKPLQASRAGSVHSWLVALQYGGVGAGMLVFAPALYFAGGSQAMIGGSILGFVLLTACGLVLARRIGHLAAPDSSARSPLAFGKTLRFFGQSQLARYAVATLAIKMMVSKGIVVALPFYLESDLGLGLGGLVYLIGAGAVGVVAGLLWCSRTLSLERAHSVMVLSTVGMGVSLAALAALDYCVTAVARYSYIPPVTALEAQMNTPFVVALPVAFLLGLCMSGALISSRVALTETAPVGQHGRVFAVQLLLTELLIALPLMSLGIGTTVAGARTTLAALSGLVLLILAIMELDRRRSTAVPATAPGLELPGLAPEPVLVRS